MRESMRILICGDQGVGKSTLITSFIHSTFIHIQGPCCRQESIMQLLLSSLRKGGPREATLAARGLAYQFLLSRLAARPTSTRECTSVPPPTSKFSNSNSPRPKLAAARKGGVVQGLPPILPISTLILGRRQLFRCLLPA